MLTFLATSLVLLVGLSQAGPVAVSLPPVLACPSIMAKAGASPKFTEHAGHAIHSLTVEDLQKFEPAVTVHNKVPTVNRNMSAPDGVLRSAPDLRTPGSKRYKSEVMKVLDTVLMHMDDPEYFRRYTSVVERVAHEAHMCEHWAHILVRYQEIKKEPLSEDFCACAMDVENNGLMDVLRNAALLIREPKLTLGYDPSNYTQGDLRYYMLFAVVIYPPQLTHDLYKKPEGHQLSGKDAWIQFKAKNGETHEEIRDAAMFLHCALKEERELAKATRAA